MKTVKPSELRTAYVALFPSEGSPNLADLDRIFGNWLEQYEANPDRAIATQNWCGKVTRALFAALKLRQPRTKRDMLAALS